MSVVRIAVPVSVGSVTVHVSKGRRWSVVEHLLLEAVCVEPRTAHEIAAAGSLPERMVVEAFINLMRAGWVELRTEGRRSVFCATAGGRDNVRRDELPAITRLIRRPVRYVVERVTGSVLRYRELDFIWASLLRKAPEQVDLVVAASHSLPEVRQLDAIAAMLNEDEEYRGVVASSARHRDGFAIVSVTNGKARGLPSTAPDSLRTALIRAAGSHGRKAVSVRLQTAAPPVRRFPARRTSFSIDDVILGGEAHRSLLGSLIRTARSSIVIHSTFIGHGDFMDVVGQLAAAARDRGVGVDIFWGKSDHRDEENATRTACGAINAEMKRHGLSHFVRAHSFSTQSHAKLIVADDGADGFVGVVGSCNWLSSGFSSFEASVRLTNRLIVSDLMDALGEMAHTVTGLNGGVAAELSGQAINMRRRPGQPDTGRAQLRLLLGPEHAESVLDARDAARETITVGSHKLGLTGIGMSLRPIAAAVRENAISMRLFYEEPSSELSQEQCETLTKKVKSEGMLIERRPPTGMHAKFVSWDQNDLIVTSQNLLSANPGTDYAEIGLHIQAPGIALLFAQRLDRLLLEPVGP